MKMVDECTFKKRLGLPTFTSQSTNLQTLTKKIRASLGRAYARVKNLGPATKF
jgi:hypothetical protein